MMISLAGCKKSPVYKLQQLVQEANRECPEDIGSGFTMESMTYDEDENTVEMVCSSVMELPSEYVEYYEKNKEVLKTLMMSALVKELGGNKDDFIGPIIDADANLTFVYKFGPNAKPISIKLTPSDLSNMDEMDPLKSKEEMLKAMIDMANSTQKGMETDGVAFNEIKYDGDNVVYDITYDESAVTVDAFKTVENEYKQMMLKSPELQPVMEMITDLGKGMKIVINGAKTKKKVEIIITEEDYRGHSMMP